VRDLPSARAARSISAFSAAEARTLIVTEERRLSLAIVANSPGCVLWCDDNVYTSRNA
jgi:hypothetical protein